MNDTFINRLSQAYAVWCQIHPNDTGEVSMANFAAFIQGYPSQQEHKLDLLLGPYAHAIIKAYQARQGN